MPLALGLVLERGSFDHFGQHLGRRGVFLGRGARGLFALLFVLLGFFLILLFLLFRFRFRTQVRSWSIFPQDGTVL